MPWGSIDVTFAGQQFVMSAAGALYWPARQALILSDMHLEKSTFLAQYGSFVAPYDTRDTLERLERLIAHFQPQELLLLGDSFHDAQAWQRLDAPSRAQLQRIVDQVPVCRWIEGNHDVQLRATALAPFESAYEHLGILFTHEPAKTSVLPQIIGHFHPKVRLFVRGRSVSGKCFAHTKQLLILPAFGTYTGGLDIQHPAFEALAKGEAFHLHLIHKTSIHHLPSLQHAQN